MIARTLGVIDETKASTSSELEHAELHKNQPTIVVDDPDVSLAAATPLPAEPSAEDVDGNLKLSGVDTFSPAPSQPGSPTMQRREFMQHQYAHYGSDTSMYDRGGRDGLPGANPNPNPNVNTSASSSPPSNDARGGRPGKPRAGGDRDGDRNARAVDGTASPRGPSGHRAAGSHSHSNSGSSGEESYAIVDRDAGSGTEDAGTVMLRRRTRQTGTGSGAGDGAE